MIVRFAVYGKNMKELFDAATEETIRFSGLTKEVLAAMELEAHMDVEPASATATGVEMWRGLVVVNFA